MDRDIVTAGKHLLAIRSVPGIIHNAGPNARRRFLEFFTVTIRNKNTRMAYAIAVADFFAWADSYDLQLIDIEPIAVAAYVEQLTHRYAAPTVKQHLAALRMLFDWLVTGQILVMNPASCVRGPKHVVKRGKTPVLSAVQARQLLDSIEETTLMGLRDRALLSNDLDHPGASRCHHISLPQTNAVTWPI